MSRLVWRRGVVALTLLATLGVGRESAAQLSSTRSSVRAVNSRLAAALRHGLAQSPTVAELVATLDASNVVVYLHDGGCDSPVESCLMIGRGGEALRILRVNFRLSDARRNKYIDHFDQLIAQLAHELQHAVEIASERGVVDTTTLESTYGRIGRSRPTSRGIAFETDAAIRVGREVLRELRGSRRRPRQAAQRPVGGAAGGATDPE